MEMRRKRIMATLPEGDEMPIFGSLNTRSRHSLSDALLQTLQAESGKGGSSAKKKDVGHG